MLQLAPESITRVTVVADAAPAVFVRQADGWVREGSAAAVDAELAEIIDRAVKFMHTANPVRALEHQEIADAGLAEFGLDHPRLWITLEDAGGVVLAADFGNAQRRRPAPVHAPEGSRRPLPDVGLRRQGVAGRPRRRAPRRGRQAPRPLVPLPIGEVAAVEIYARDKSYRFERDARGAWLLHRHAPGDASGRAPSRRSGAERAHRPGAGRVRPDPDRAQRRLRCARATPTAWSIRRRSSSCSPTTRRGRRSTLRSATCADGLGRYLQMPDHTEIVAVPDDQITRPHRSRRRARALTRPRAAPRRRGRQAGGRDQPRATACGAGPADEMVPMSMSMNCGSSSNEDWRRMRPKAVGRERRSVCRLSAAPSST